jgi:uncharacterized protein YcbX
MSSAAKPLMSLDEALAIMLSHGPNTASVDTVATWDADGRVWWCSLSDDAALDAEADWLKANVYFRGARVQLEKLNSRVQFSLRPGEVTIREL